MSNTLEFGIKMACAAMGVTPEEFLEKQGYVEAITRSDATKRMICKLAVEMYDGCGKDTYFQRHFLDVLSKDASWDESSDHVVDDVLTGIGKALSDIESEDTNIKSAGMISKYMLANVIGKGVGATPALLEHMLTAGVATGAAAGGLGWYLNKHTNEDDDDLEVTRSRINNYHRITKEISDQLKRTGKLPVTGELQDIVNEQPAQ